MNDAVTDWLPRSAFTDDAVSAALGELVGGWSERWFAVRTAVISAVRLRDSPLFPVGPKCLHFRGRVASAELTERGKRSLLEAALDVDLSKQVLSEGDRALLGAFATEVVEDLIFSLDKEFAEESAQGVCRQINLTLAIEKSDLFSVSFPDHSLVPMVKARCGGARSTTANLQSRPVALAPTRIIAEALLGMAEVGAKDLKGLAVGDVLVLDRTLHDTVELRLCGGAKPFARGKLGRNGGQISIEL